MDYENLEISHMDVLKRLKALELEVKSLKKSKKKKLNSKRKA